MIVLYVLIFLFDLLVRFFLSFFYFSFPFEIFLVIMFYYFDGLRFVFCNFVVGFVHD